MSVLIPVGVILLCGCCCCILCVAGVFKAKDSERVKTGIADLKKKIGEAREKKGNAKANGGPETNLSGN